MNYTRVELLIGGLMVGAMIAWAAVKSDDPLRLILRWVVTFLMLWVIFKQAVPILFTNQAGAIVGVLILAACGIVIGLTWAASWATIGLSPLTSAFDGGDEQIEEKALYSSAETKRKKGHYAEAIADIEAQLERFPNDYQGLLMLAEIQAQHFQSLSAAQVTVDRICEAHLDVPARAVSALMMMSDWYQKEGQIERSRENLQRILDSYPHTTYAQLAAQRLASLEKTQQTIEERGRTIVMQPQYEKYVGLKEIPRSSEEQDPKSLAAEYLSHLELHPLDIETRHKLAALYAESFQRIDLAQLEYEQLIAQPNQSPKQVAQHLNYLADWQAKLGHGEAARHTLQRIVDRFPKTALAEAALMRMANLGTEVRKEKSQASVKLGSYKKDLGLNRDH